MKQKSVLAIATPHLPPKFLHSLAKVVLDNRITFYYIFAEQGGVCCGQHYLLYLVQLSSGSLNSCSPLLMTSLELEHLRGKRKWQSWKLWAWGHSLWEFQDSAQCHDLGLTHKGSAKAARTREWLLRVSLMPSLFATCLRLNLIKRVELLKKKEHAQNGVICPHDSKPRPNCQILF